jgi:hypothetical protein
MILLGSFGEINRKNYFDTDMKKHRAEYFAKRVENPLGKYPNSDFDLCCENAETRPLRRGNRVSVLDLNQIKGC